MRTLFSSLLAGLVGLVCVTACGVSAQPRSRTSGLAEGLALPGVFARPGSSLVGLVVSTDDAGPVRLELGAGNGVAALVDVHVLANAASAGERLSSIEPALSSRGVVAAPGLGDRALADEAGTVVAFVRANVLVVVRTIEIAGVAPLDARAIAARLVSACDAAPRLRSGRVPRAEVTVPSVAWQAGPTLVVPTPADAVAMRIGVEGDGIARGVDGGWEVARGTGSARIQVMLVDALLRVAR